MTMQKTKKCAKCGITKPKSEFHRARREPSGVVSRCKACRKIESKEDYPKRKAYFQQYTRDNRERINARIRRKNGERREQKHALKKAWRQLHPMDSKRHGINANAKKYGAEERVTLHELEALWAAQGGTCPLTEITFGPRVATPLHIQHLAEGGANRIDNLIFVTRQVVRHRGTMPLEVFCELAGLDFDLINQRIEGIHSKLEVGKEVNLS
jgi:hypothetical protein